MGNEESKVARLKVYSTITITVETID